MKIYIAHATCFDFRGELYTPLQASTLAREHTLIFPHSESDEPFDTKRLFKDGCDMVLAEVSYPSTGLGIELGWAQIFDIPIVCIHKQDAIVSNSLKVLTKQFISYADITDMVAQIERMLLSKQ